jgi:hypothetical protein
MRGANSSPDHAVGDTVPRLIYARRRFRGRAQRRKKAPRTTTPGPELGKFRPLTIFSTGLGRDSMTILALAEAGQLKLGDWPFNALEDLDAVVFSDPGHEWPLTYAAGVETAAVCVGRVPFYQLRKPNAVDTRHYAEVIYPAARKKVFAERKRRARMSEAERKRKNLGLRVEVSRLKTSPWLHRKYRSPAQKARDGGYHVRLPLLQEYMLLGRSTTRMRAECTVAHKIEPVRALLNDLLLEKYGVTLAWWGEEVKAGRLEPNRMILGIAYDEPKRVRPWEPEKGSVWGVRDVYPLVAAGITKKDESRILAERGWGWVHKSGCMGCHYQNAAWFYMVRELHPAMFALLVESEKRSEAVRGEDGEITALGVKVLGTRALAREAKRLRIKGPDRIDKEVADWAASTTVLKLAITSEVLSEDFRRKLAKYDKGYTRIPNRKTPTWRQVAWITPDELANPKSRLPAAWRKAMRKQMFAEFLAKGYDQDCAFGKAGEKKK